MNSVMISISPVRKMKPLRSVHYKLGFKSLSTDYKVQYYFTTSCCLSNCLGCDEDRVEHLNVFLKQSTVAQKTPCL